MRLEFQTLERREVHWGDAGLQANEAAVNTNDALAPWP